MYRRKERVTRKNVFQNLISLLQGGKPSFIDSQIKPKVTIFCFIMK